MKIYKTLPDDPDFHPFRIYLFMAIPICLLLALLIAGGIYGFYDWIDRKTSKPIIEHIEKLTPKP